MTENIKWLIEEYQHEIETLEEDRKDGGIGFCNAICTAKIGVYGKVIKDLQSLLEVSE